MTYLVLPAMLERQRGVVINLGNDLPLAAHNVGETEGRGHQLGVVKWLSLLQMTYLVLPAMLERQRGVVINLGSLNDCLCFRWPASCCPQCWRDRGAWSSTWGMTCLLLPTMLERQRGVVINLGNDLPRAAHNVGETEGRGHQPGVVKWLSLLQMTCLLLPTMLERQRGVVINLGSLNDCLCFRWPASCCPQCWRDRGGVVINLGPLDDCLCFRWPASCCRQCWRDRGGVVINLGSLNDCLCFRWPVSCFRQCWRDRGAWSST